MEVLSRVPSPESRVPSPPALRVDASAIDGSEFQSLWSELLASTRRWGSKEVVEDAAAEAILAALRQPERVAVDRTRLAWLVTATQNNLKNAWKRTRRRAAEAMEDPVDPRSLRWSPEAWLADWVLHLHGKLGRERDRVTLHMLTLGASPKEIAGHLGVTLREVQRSVARLRARALEEG